MSSVVYDICTYLANQGHGQLTAPITIWGHTIPHEPNDALSVLTIPSPKSCKAMGTVVFEEVRVQIQVRDTKQDDCETRMYNVYKELEAIGDITINGTLYKYIEASLAPSKLRQDEKNRCIFYCEFDVCRVVPV